MTAGGRRRVAMALMAALFVVPSAAWADDDDDEGGDDEESVAGDKGGFKVDDGDIDRTGKDDDDEDDAPVVSEFEKDVFFLDKVDDRKTIDTTLLQGNFTSSSFIYRESGGKLATDYPFADSNSPVVRYFTDLRSRLAARHIAGGRWDFRVDGRVRFSAQPDRASETGTFEVGAQSGANGRNEYQLREFALSRVGDSSTISIGRQLVAELAATPVDGLRVDYAKSSKLTLLGFAGLLPVRGARSVGFDYPKVPAGRLLPIGGGVGASYRTKQTYGSFGVVTMVPGKGADPRVLLTSTGYWRQSPKFDAYHYAVIDVIGDAGFAATNLSLGVDYRPEPRIRLSAQVNRVDTDTLDIVAQALLSDPSTDGGIQNDVAVLRIASNQGRVGASVSLGELEAIEISTAVAVRQRGAITLSDGLSELPGSKNVEVWAQLLHRRLFSSRVGVEVAKIFGFGDATYNRSSVLASRLFASREFKGGRGEWEAGLSYASADDDTIGSGCAEIVDCFGASKTKTLGVTGNVYYRLTGSIFGMLMLDVNRYTTTADGAAKSDAAVLGVSGFVRLSYRY